MTIRSADESSNLPPISVTFAVSVELGVASPERMGAFAQPRT